MPTLRQIVEENDSREGRIFDIFIQILIVLSLVSFSLETLPDLSEGTRAILHGFEIIVIIVFTVEYILRILFASNKPGFIFSFYGIIDLLAILPFYIALGLDLRSVRIFRLLRLFRAFKLVKYNSAFRRFHLALVLVKEEVVLFIIITLMLMFISSVGIYYFEHEAQPEHFKSIFHSLWWAVGTFSTVGYGDIYPVTAGGKIFTFLILVIGLGMIAIPSGMVASGLTQAREMMEVEDELPGA